MKTPQRPETHRVGDTGQTAVALKFKKWGWTADPIASDYGEDLDCTIFTEGRRTALHFRCQVKSSASADATMRKLKSGEYVVRINATTCAAWAVSYFPVIVVVYDDSTEQMYWADATTQIRENVKAISKETFGVRVPRNLLETGREAILQVVSRFYANLLRLSQPEFQCAIFPVLMPGHRVLSWKEAYDFTRMTTSKDITLTPISRSLDGMPAWATTLNLLDGSVLSGLHASYGGDSIEGFMATLADLLKQLKYPHAKGEWLAFVTSPISFQVREDTASTELWNREITDWWCYSVVHEQTHGDFDYAFALPDSFLKQIGRRARSWDGRWHVDPIADLAIEMFATVPTMPSYRAQVAAHRKHASGQFLPWMSRRGDIGAIQEGIWPLELVFREIKAKKIKPPRGYVYGVITTPMFDPQVGLIPQAMNWEEFTHGTVRVRLEKSGVFSHIPGKIGPTEINDWVLGIFGSSFGRAAEELIISGFDYVPGLPVDHSQRIISVQRFCLADVTTVVAVEAAMDDAKRSLRKYFRRANAMKIDYRVFSSFSSKVLHLWVSWTPDLTETAQQSFEIRKEFLLTFFNSVLPSEGSGSGASKKTLEILRLDGELYFEGDKMWGWSVPSE